MTYTPKTKRPTVKSLIAEVKRLREEVNSTGEALIDSGDMRRNLVRDLSEIYDLAVAGNGLGYRKDTLNKIATIAFVAKSKQLPT